MYCLGEKARLVQQYKLVGHVWKRWYIVMAHALRVTHSPSGSIRQQATMRVGRS